MKKGGILFLTMMILISFCGVALAGDTLNDVKKKGVLVAGVKDSTPGFGYIDEKTQEIVGYDIDFCKAIAKKLGVKLQLKAVTSATRIPKLIAGDIDIIAATVTKTEERAKQIDFSYAYFNTIQKVLTRKGAVKKLADLDGKNIGTLKRSNSEQNAKKALSKASIIPFDDYAHALSAFQQGKVDAISSDESILEQLHAKTPNKDQCEIPGIIIFEEPYGLGIRKGDTKFIEFVNATLLEMEKKGEAKKIFDKWFGSKSPLQQKRSFKITAMKMPWEH
jgi:polar amino acid transport system substrate-binding protein